jgi:hypothetical protein
MTDEQIALQATGGGVVLSVHSRASGNPERLGPRFRGDERGFLMRDDFRFFFTVMAGLVPAIHVLFLVYRKTWIPGIPA